MIRIRNREMTRMPGAERKRCGFQNGVLFSVLAAGAAILTGITNAGYVTVLAAEDTAETVNIDDIDNEASTQADDTGQVYDFKDNKTTGTVTVTKVWDDGLTNDEREIPDIKISTKKPSKSTLGCTVTFHGDASNGLLFDDGSETNDVVYNSAGQIVSGSFKVPGGISNAALSWLSDTGKMDKIDVREDGKLLIKLSGDIDLYCKMKTFEASYNLSGTWQNTAGETFTRGTFPSNVADTYTKISN